MANFVVGVTGASGIPLAHLAIDALTGLGHTVHLVMSRDALLTAAVELGSAFATMSKFVGSYSLDQRELIKPYKIHDFTAAIASGSFRTDGMLIVPCSMTTLAAVASGLADNLLRRAADVTLKERRRLVLIPRETPLSEIHLQNMLTLTRMGAVIVPPVPAWYNHPKDLRDVERFVVGRALDLLGVDAALFPRWQGVAQCVSQPLDASPL